MIDVNLLKISPDHKKLSFDLSAPLGYKFKTFDVWTEDEGESKIQLGADVYVKDNNIEIGYIPLDKLYGGNRLYFIDLAVEWSNPLVPRPECGRSMVKRVIIADLNKFYYCMITYAMDLFKPCTDSKDKLINIYLMETMLKKAIELERIKDAIFWFKELNRSCVGCRLLKDYEGCPDLPGMVGIKPCDCR